MAVKAAMVRAQETAAAWVRLFNDLSAKPDICNPNDGRIPAEGSQMGSQRRQAVTDAGRPCATVDAAKWHVEPRSLSRRPLNAEERWRNDDVFPERGAPHLGHVEHVLGILDRDSPGI